MRIVMIAATMLAGTAPDAQQRVVVPGPTVARPQPQGTPAPQPVAARRGQHWGGRANGYWVGGTRAPGGYASYRRLVRGYALPTYWARPGFAVADWSLYGLYAPSTGQRWTRYYDDAVLVDARGSVLDSVPGVDWDQYDLDYANDGYGATAVAFAPPSPPAPPPPPVAPELRRGNGVGGAVGGGPVSAGAGAIAGYAIDRAHRGGRSAPPPPPGAGYPPPDAYAGGGYDDGAYERRDHDRRYHPGPFAPPVVVQSGGGTTVTTSTVGGLPGGTWVNGYYYPPATVTTVSIESAPVVTTTTTEYFEDSVTYTRPPVHRAHRKRVYRRVPTCYCRPR